MGHRPMFICNNHKCILNRNLDWLQHVKDVNNYFDRRINRKTNITLSENFKAIKIPQD